MANHWFTRYAENYGFPDNYTTVDVETNGLSPERNLVCTIGVCIVRDRRISRSEEAVLDWTRHPDIDQVWLHQTLEQTQQALERQGKNFYHTWDYLHAHGEPVQAVLDRYLTLFEECENNREMLVAHNGWRFDVEFLQAAFHNYLRVAFRFDENLVYDSGVAEKASQLDDADEPLPRPDETIRDWAYRVGGLRRRGIMWALDSHCEDRYALTASAGFDASAFHRSGQDAILLHYLMEEHRALATIAEPDNLRPYDEPDDIPF